MRGVCAPVSRTRFADLGGGGRFIFFQTKRQIKERGKWRWSTSQPEITAVAGGWFRSGIPGSFGSSIERGFVFFSRPPRKKIIKKTYKKTFFAPPVRAPLMKPTKSPPALNRRAPDRYLRCLSQAPHRAGCCLFCDAKQARQKPARKAEFWFAFCVLIITPPRGLKKKLATHRPRGGIRFPMPAGRHENTAKCRHVSSTARIAPPPLPCARRC